MAGARFLDLCAGSGAVGIEALSRGAAQITFADRSRQMCALVEANLAALEIPPDEIAVVCREAGEFLRRRARQNSTKATGADGGGSDVFDIIFFDPPYATDYDVVLGYCGENGRDLLAEGGLVIVEHHRKNELKDSYGSLRRYRELKQGDSCLSFYQIE